MLTSVHVKARDLLVFLTLRTPYIAGAPYIFRAILCTVPAIQNCELRTALESGRAPNSCSAAPLHITSLNNVQYQLSIS
jgi:hypothetical protein